MIWVVLAIVILQLVDMFVTMAIIRFAIAQDMPLWIYKSLKVAAYGKAVF
jgi:hypothetical protein